MAAAFFGRENPVGRRLTMGEGAESRSVEVIGVVRDSVYQRLQDEPRRVVYVPYMQTPRDPDGGAASMPRCGRRTGDPIG